MLMNSFTNTILTLLLGWLRTLLNAARDFISSDSSTAFFTFFRNNWRVLFLVLCVGGFVLDKIIYLIRWRPSPIWIRRHARRVKHRPQPDTYDLPEFNDDAPIFQTNDYEPVSVPAYPDAAPTMQYQPQTPQYARQTIDSQPTYPPYAAAPQYAPDAVQNDYTANETTSWNGAPQEPFAPAQEQQQRFAFGMEPSFGSAQSEPAYSYQRDAVPSFAPPRYAQEKPRADLYAPPSAYEQPAELYQDAPAAAYPESNPYFRPFTDRGGDPYAPPKSKRLGTVAKKARSLLQADEANESLTYQDLYPAVDVSKSFHSPVYPEKKPKGDA
jgi:hypothetical protein